MALADLARGSPAPWWLAWGELDRLPDRPIWREKKLAVFSPADPGPWRPCCSPSGQYAVIGDLWITNANALRKQLDLAGGDGSSHPLEMAAYLWQQQGVDSLNQLQGMFCFVVYDRWRKCLWLARDAIGGKTLYYSAFEGTYWISPQLRSLGRFHSNALDLVALRDYLCCAFVPGDRTLWADVREVRPGQVVRLPQATSQIYFQLQEKIVGASEPLAWHGDRLRALLEQVVADHLPRGEPVGIYLSGGLDSSCVTALAAAQHTHPIHTFSIHFGDAHPNELEYARVVATHCQTTHHVLEITMQALWDVLPETMGLLDDPIGDPLTVPNLLVGRLARQVVDVILNGEGGDPCFGGPKNQPMLIHRLYAPIAQQNPLQAYLLSFQKCASDLPNLLRPEVWQVIKEAPSVFAQDLSSPASYLNQLMALNIKFKGADHILTKVNNLTQAAGLQGRSPLFDRRIVEMSMQIPPAYKLSGVDEKAVLKQAMASSLPRSILLRPKSGMMVPVQTGFRRHWQRRARRLLLHRQAAIAPYLNRDLIQGWLAYRGDTWDRYGVKLWLLTSLELWLRAHSR